MARKKPGYDWITNTYYYEDPLPDLIAIFIPIAVVCFIVEAIVAFYKEIIIAIFVIFGLLVLIGIVSLLVSSSRKKQALARQKERLKKQQYEFVDMWNNVNLPLLKELSNRFCLVPLVHHDSNAYGVFIDQIIPQDVAHVLVYLDYPFFPPAFTSGFISVAINDEERIRISSLSDLKEPMILDVSPGDHLSVFHTGNDDNPVMLNNLMVSLCKTRADLSDYPQTFNFMPLNVLDDGDTFAISTKLVLAKNFHLDFTNIERLRSAMGHAGDDRASVLFSATIPEYYSTLLSFSGSDNGNYDLASSGVTLQVFEDDELVCCFFDDYKEEKLFRLTPGKTLTVFAIYDMKHKMTFSHLYFALLPDFIPPQYSKSLSQYVPKLIKQQDADRQINGLTSMIDEYNFRLENLKGSQKRKTRKRIKELTKERSRFVKKRGKDVRLSSYVDVSNLELKLENQEKDFRSVKVKSLQADS